MNIAVFEEDEIHPDSIEILKNKGFNLFTNQQIEEQQDKVDALFIRTYTKADVHFLNKFPSLEYIIRAGSGIDNIDSNECERRNIKIISSPGSNANSVAELVICLMLMLLRSINSQSEFLRKGNWRQRTLLGAELRDKVVGIIGCGAIGQNLASKLNSFSIKTILGYDPYLSAEQLNNHKIIKSELEELLQNSDLVSIHIPLLPETKHFITIKELNMMKKSAYLINTSRGDVVNENDLINALRSHNINGAALDVYENEPDIKQGLLNLDNLILTPHIGAFTKESEKSMCIEAVNNFIDSLDKTISEKV